VEPIAESPFAFDEPVASVDRPVKRGRPRHDDNDYDDPEPFDFDGEPAEVPESHTAAVLSFWRRLNPWIKVALVATPFFGGIGIAVAVEQHDPGMLFGSLASPWLCIGLAWLIYYSRPPCPGCGRRWANRNYSGGYWEHSRIDGGPDRRFKHNRFFPQHCHCSACGHQFY
jgi:hypothetical protein